MGASMLSVHTKSWLSLAGAGMHFQHTPIHIANITQLLQQHKEERSSLIATRTRKHQLEDTMRLTIKHCGESGVATGGEKLILQVEQQIPLCRDGTASEGCIRLRAQGSAWH